MNADDALKVGGFMTYWRAARHLTLDDLSERCGMSKGQLSKIERGLSIPSLVNSVQIANGLGLTLSELFREVDLPPELSSDEHLLIEACRRNDMTEVVRILSRISYGE